MATLTRVLRHVVLELIHPLALVAAVRAEVFALLLVDPHVVLGRGTRGTVRVRPCRLPRGHAGLWDASKGLTGRSEISVRGQEGWLVAWGSTAGSG